MRRRHDHARARRGILGVATESIDRLFTTATSHSRVFVVELMGRYAGWIALYAGVAGGADAV